MSDCHEPTIHESYLRQALSLGKRPIALLLGAGCPAGVKVASPGGLGPIIPDINGLTERVLQINAAALKDTIRKIVGQCTDERCPEPNVERLLSHVRALNEIAEGREEAVLGLTSTQLRDVDRAICELIVKVMDVELPDPQQQVTAYHNVARWLRDMRRDQHVEIFTTNYDLLMEQALDEERVPYFDGFVGGAHPFFDPHAIEDDLLPARWARLWKLHGSINWRRSERYGVYRTSSSAASGEYVIHPSHLKYDQVRRMPYLAMVDRLRSFLKRQSAVLVICGYSFGDTHLNEVVEQGLAANASAMAFALLYLGIEAYQKAVDLAKKHSNVSVFCPDGAVIGTQGRRWGGEPPEESGLFSAVEWLQEDGDTGSERPWKATCKLGDFQCFGEFLADLIGSDARKDGGRGE